METESEFPIPPNRAKRKRLIERLILPDTVKPRKLTVYLPEEIIDEILYRLPIKSLLRFKCVCKFWHSAISNPMIHQKRGLELFLRIEPQNRTYSYYSIEEGDKIFMLSSFSVGYSGMKNFFSNSCNGFVILGFGESFFLFNPSTRYMVKVLALNCMRSNGVVVAGLCYSASTNDYKVVIRFTHRNNNKVVAVASLKTKRWAQINFPFDAASTKAGPIVNGRMHWTVNVVHNQQSSKKIICFDPCTDLFEEFPSPVVGHAVETAIIGLGVIRERLYAITRGYGTSIRIFIMKEYGVGQSWTNLHYTRIFNPPYLFTKNGEIFGRMNPNQILGYDPIKNRNRIFDLGNPKEVLSTVSFVQNLASPVGYEWNEVQHANCARNIQWLDDNLG